MDEAFLDLSSESQIQIQVRHRGLDILVPQAVFDLSGGVSPGEHVDRTRMSKAVHGIDVLKALGGQSHGEIFSTEAIDPEAGEFLSALVDKETLPIR